MKRFAIAAALSASLVAFPALSADARPAKGGKSVKVKKSKRCAKQHRVGFVAGGTLAGFDGQSVTLTVQRANRHARRYLESNPPTFSTVGARVSFVDVTDAGDNGVGFEDVLATDRVAVIGKLSVPKRRCTGEVSLAVRKVVVVRPEA